MERSSISLRASRINLRDARWSFFLEKIPIMMVIRIGQMLRKISFMDDALSLRMSTLIENKICSEESLQARSGKGGRWDP